MKVVIFAGGIGTRISEESHLRPKPMIEIGGKPILWHIMKFYETQGFSDFVICLGYKGNVIKEYFNNYYLNCSDITFDIRNNTREIHESDPESFRVTLVDTGLYTKTAGRLNRVKKYLRGETFMLTYGDGVSDINLKRLLDFHKKHKKIATVTAIQPSGRFGAFDIAKDGMVTRFIEKPKGDGQWLNGGFFVLEPDVFNYLGVDADNTMWEEHPMATLGKDGQLVAYQHPGFWKCMDAIRDKIELENLWENQKALWKIWT